MKELSRYWGSIVSAARGRLGVAGAWTAVKTFGYTRTEVTVPATIQDMNALYGIAVDNREAASRLMALTTTQEITSEHIGLTVNARTLEARNAAPAYYARLQYTSTLTGEQVTTWLTVDLPYQITATKGTFMSSLTTLTTAIMGTYPSAGGTAKGQLVSIDYVTLQAY